MKKNTNTNEFDSNITLDKLQSIYNQLLDYKKDNLFDEKMMKKTFYYNRILDEFESMIQYYIKYFEL